jgi:hypothetical protein
MEYKTNGLMQIMELLPNIPDSNGAIDYSLWNGLILMEIIVTKERKY